mgnify:CR=1 FL=1
MVPISVTLNKNKKSIQFEYHNNSHLLLTSSYLRACSPSAENKNKQNLLGESKELDLKIFEFVLIKKIEAVGNYAIRIIFDDGHNTGIFSWEYIYKIGSRSQDSLTP